MAQLALSLAGGGLGYMAGGPMGAQVGFAAGSFLGGMLDKETIRQEGPRLNDLRVTDSAYGQFLPICYGTIPVAGNIIDASDLYETKHTKKTGGGKGGSSGPTVKQTTWSYSVDLAISLCEGTIAGLLQLYANERLIYDQTTGTSIGKPDWLNIRVYTGSETQDPDPTLEAIHGAGEVPGYRGTAYIVLRRFQLEPFNNTIPNFRAVVAVDGSTSNEYAEITDTMISSTGALLRHPNTGAIFVTGAGATGIGGRAYNPFNSVPLFTLDQGDTGGFPDNSNEAGFFSVPLVLDGIEYDLGPNRHFFYGNSLGHGITIFDSYTGARIAALSLQSCGGANNDAAVVIDESAGKIARVCDVLPNYYLMTYNIVNSGSLEGSTAQSTAVPWPSDIATGYSDWQWHPDPLFPNGTDRSGVIATTAEHKSTGDDYFVTVENNRIRAKTTTGLSDFADPTATRVVWDSVREYFWLMGAKTGDTTKTIFKAYDRDCSVIETHEHTMSWALVVRDDFYAQDSAIYSVRISNGTLYKFSTGTGDLESWTGFPSTGGWNWTGFAWHGPTDTGWTVHNTSDKLVRMIPDRLSTATTTLDDVAGDILDRADVASGDYDVTGLSSVTVRGYRIGRRITARSAIEPLRMGYVWDLIDNGAKLKAILRGQSSVATLDNEDLGAREDSDDFVPLVTVSRAQDVEVPRELTISYLDVNSNYEPGAQRAIRLASNTDEKRDIQLALVFDEDEAAQLCEVLLHAFQIERNRYSFSSHLGNIHLEGADVVTLDDGSSQFLGRIVTSEISGPLIAFEALREYDVYTSTVSGVPGRAHTATVVYAGPTLLFILDMPMLREADNDPGFYVAAGSYTESWPGCAVYKSKDLITYQFVEGVGSQAAFGFVQGAGAEGVMNVFDETTSLDVELTTGTLASVTTEQCLEEVNAAAWGQVGRWEIILFKDVTDNGGGSYTVTNLVRGMRSTGHNRDNHQPGDIFVVLDEDTLQRIGIETAEIDVTAYYKGVTFGDTVDDSASAELTVTPEAHSLMPWEPVNIRFSGWGGDITIAFYRQDRVRVAAFQQPGQSEDSASYECDVYDQTSSPPGAFLRKLTATSESFTYSSANQTTDFGGAASAGDFSVTIYQISATVGRGYGASETT